MLVISRKEGETVVVGDAVIRILHSSSSRVSIGIEATKDVRVLRGELIEKDRKEAA